jgi:hypothetical protein
MIILLSLNVINSRESQNIDFANPDARSSESIGTSHLDESNRVTAVAFNRLGGLTEL